MINVIVCGGCGKMGGQLVSLISQDKEMKLMGAIEEKNHSRINKTIIGDLTVTDDLERIINETDVVIEFTNPEASLEHLEIAAKYRKAIVIGTTGLNDEQIGRIKKFTNPLCDIDPRQIPCVLAPNMSAGVNLLFKLVKEVAKILPDYDVEIIEAHHNKKKEAPSGTAEKLSKEICAGYDEIGKPPFLIIYGRQGMIGPRKSEEIGIHAVRAGDIVGEHTVIFAGPGERIELIHRAHSRDVFAHGAIKAAKWIVGKPAGLYDMQDVLGIK